MRVLFRADASSTLGGGHVRRCLSLARALESLEAECRFACRTSDVSYASLGLDTPFGVSGEDDAAATLAAIDGFAADWVVVDHYRLGRDWHDTVREATGARIAVIDDLADRDLSADLLVDHNWHEDHAAKYGSRVAGDTRILGGPRFALLDPVFADAGHAPIEDHVSSIGVFMGATDPGGASAKVLEAIDASGFAGEVEVVSTSANPQLAALREAIEARPATNLTLDAPNLARFMAAHGLQVGSGGGATWERCAAGAPALAAILTDNQQASLPAMANLDALHLHDARPLDPVLLAGEISKLLADRPARESMAERARKLVDGRGALRVAAAMAPLSLRAATQDDSARAYEWRNAPETRRLSGDPSPIEREGHESWWAAALANPDRHLLVCELATRPAGVLRFDWNKQRQATVSIYFDPALTGLGLGTRLLEDGRAWLAAEESRADTLVAHIDPANHASLAIFERAGYRRAADGTYRRLVGADQLVSRQSDTDP